MEKSFKVISAILIVGFPSWMLADFEANLSYGTKDAEIKNVQLFLKNQGLFSEDATGNYYLETEAAVKAFQLRYGAEPASGYLGPLTQIKTTALLKKEVLTPSPLQPKAIMTVSGGKNVETKKTGNILSAITGFIDNLKQLLEKKKSTA